MRNRRVPRSAGGAVSALVEGLAPASGLAALQRVWPDAVGDVIAAQAHPAAERDGVVTVTCSSRIRRLLGIFSSADASRIPRPTSGVRAARYKICFIRLAIAAPPAE